MAPEIGLALLLLIACTSALGMVVRFTGNRLGVEAVQTLLTRISLGTAVMAFAAFSMLVLSFIQADFSVLLAANHSSISKPLLYKITGVWGNHEGSMLLWLLILTLYSAAFAWRERSLAPPLHINALTVLHALTLGFAAFVAFTSNPFERTLPPPLDGNGLNPVLEDVALAIHPPMLYLGYVGFAVVFALGVSILLHGQGSTDVWRALRRWSLAAWSFLTLGIGLGSWWAYRELGWGGYWFWDPVENASLLPWIAGTALIHSLAVTHKRQSLQGWTLLLALMAFVMALLGTFLVRSGVLTSVHAFASDPERGVFILLLISMAAGYALAVYGWKAPRFSAGGVFSPLSREGALLVNNMLLMAALTAVFLGTLYPLFMNVLSGPQLSVGEPYYKRTVLPLMAVAILVAGFAPLLRWERDTLRALSKRLRAPAFVTITIAGAYALLADGRPLLAAGGIALAVWLMMGTARAMVAALPVRRDARDSWLHRLFRLPAGMLGMALSHIGLALLTAGITLTGVYEEGVERKLAMDDSVTIHGYRFQYRTVEALQMPNYVAVRATLDVTRAGTPAATLFPERRFYPVQKNHTSEAVIANRWWGDLYAVISDVDKEKRITGRFYVVPGIHLLWLAVGLMALGGFVSMKRR